MKQDNTFPIVKRQYLLLTLCFVLTCLHSLTLYGSQVTLIPQYNEETVRVVLMDEVPDLTIHSMTLISSGLDNLVADINGEWIFRFPLLKEFIPILEREKLVLKRLKNTVSMPVPHYQYIGTRTAFVGYRKIIGESLNKKLYLNLSDETRQKIAESLALFLSQFHRSISIKEALEWGYQEYHIPLHSIEHHLLGTLPSNEMERIVKEALVYTKENLYKINHLVLLHNDLHGENLAFDINKEEIAGVFDFSDGVIGDYSIEFGKLFSIHQDLALRTSEAYASLNHIPNPILPAAADYILRRASYILNTRKCVDNLKEANLLQMLENFIPVWDDLKKAVHTKKQSPLFY